MRVVPEVLILAAAAAVVAACKFRTVRIYEDQGDYQDGVADRW